MSPRNTSHTFSHHASASGPGDPDAVASPETTLARALAPTFTVHELDHRNELMTHLDTADWRLLRAGIDLVSAPASGQLIASRRSRPPVSQVVAAPSWPAKIIDIPEGPVRALIERAVWVRALIPFATSRAHATGYAVLNDDTKTVARVRWWDASLESPVTRMLPARVEVEHLRGYAAEATRVERLLVSGTALTPAGGSWFDAIRDVPGLAPSSTQRFGMRRDQAADLAVADALLGYLMVMETTVDGIVADVDTEFLHDFRVAVRRTRSVLKLLGDVLPAGLAERRMPDFRWLGDVTTPTRDLDVYLLGLDDLAATITRPEDLADFGDHIRRRRAAAQRALSRSLRSKRFLDLRAGWRAELGAVLSAPNNAQQTAARLAGQRLRRMFRKVSRQAEALTADSPSEQVHVLRKACKEMRYLLDVFRPLCDPKAYAKVIADFKELQDVLGAFQDGEVQALALREFAQEMLDGGSAEVSTILAMGELSGRFEASQRAARDLLTEHHDSYLGKRAARHIDRLVPA